MTSASFDVQIQKEEKQVRNILESVTALKLETSQSECSEEEEGEGDEDGCKEPLLEEREVDGYSSLKPGFGRNRLRGRKFSFVGLASDGESTCYTTDSDGGLENIRF